jgi:hypothetical protein
LALGISADAGATSLSGSCGQPWLQPVDHPDFPTLEHGRRLSRLTSTASKPFDWLRFADGEVIDKKTNAIHVSSRRQGFAKTIGRAWHRINLSQRHGLKIAKDS